jgi:stage V sporulation protein B
VGVKKMKSESPFGKLAKGSFFLMLDNLVNLGVGAIFWLILAKITDPAAIGQAMIITGLATTVIGFTGYGIQVTLSKYLSEYKAKKMPDSARRLLKNGLRLSVIMSASFAVVIGLLSNQITTLAYQSSGMALFLVFTIATYLPTQTILAALLGAFQGVHAMKFVAMSDSIFQVARIGIAVAALLSGFGVFGILLGFSIASCIELIVCYFVLLPRAIPRTTDDDEVTTKKPAKDGIKQIFRFTGLNYVTVGIKVLSAQLGILVLGTQSFETAAFYGLALLISKVVGSFSTSVGSALLPTASEQIVSGNKDQLQKMVNTAVRMSILVSGFGFIVLMIDPMYFLRLISESYVGAAWALRILAISAVITAIASIMTSLLNAANRPGDVAKIALVSSATTISLTLVLAPLAGLEGAAIAMFIGATVNLAMSLTVLKRKENMMVSSISIIKPFIAIMSGLLVGYVFVIFNQVLIGVLVAVACYLTFSLVYRATTRRELKQLIRIAANRKGD